MNESLNINEKNRNIYLYFICVFLISSTGLDLISVSFMSGNLRVSYFLFFVFIVIFALFKRVYLNKVEIFSFVFFIIFSFFSFFKVGDLAVFFSYQIWILANFFTVFSVFRYISINIGSEKVAWCYIFAFRIQIVFAFLLYFFGVQDRAHLYFYEPSYFVFASIPYISIVFMYHFSKYRMMYFDFFLLLLMLVATKSAFLILIFLVVYVVSGFFISKGFFKFFFKIVFFVLFFIFCVYIYYNFFDDLVTKTIYKIYHADNFIVAVLERSGNRWPRTIMVIDVLKENFLFGVGAGNYRNFSITFNSSYDYSNGIPWLNTRGLPAINIWFELLVEMGLLSFLVFLFMIFRWGKGLYKIKDFQSKVFLVIFLVFLIGFMFESNYLRMYLWGFWGCISGLIYNSRDENFKGNRSE